MRKFILTICLFFASISIASASTVSSIDMDIFVDSNGTATIKETWESYPTSGTEGYHPYYNIGKSEISVLSASMDGTPFKINNYWDEDGSLSDKANQAGIYTDGDETDVVFGITSYEEHTYTIAYQITNFVVGLNDADMIYWNLFPKNFSARPNNVTIRIYGDTPYSNSLPVWGYGMYGAPCYVYDGVIKMTSDGPISSSDYLTILVQFPKGTFVTTSQYNHDFAYYKDMADDGSQTYHKKSNFQKILLIFLGILPYIFIVVIFLFYGVFHSDDHTDRYDFGKTGRRLPGDYPFFRDIPTKDIMRAYWITKSYKLVTKDSDYLGAFILKWIKDGNVKVEKSEIKNFFKTSVEDTIVFMSEPTGASKEEIKLYNYMLEASKDGKLESNEFKKWCKNHYSKILNWFNDALDEERDILIGEGKIAKSGYKFAIDPSMYEEAVRFAGLKKFLTEFSRISEREPIEVNLWQEYLVYAQMFGIANEIMSQFKKLYPEIVSQMDEMNYGGNYIYIVDDFSRSAYQAATTAKSEASSYSSGGGGFSSGGGGGGSFGGGGGGGGFR